MQNHVLWVLKKNSNLNSCCEIISEMPELTFCPIVSKLDRQTKSDDLACVQPQGATSYFS